jgi:outer membrane protein
VGALKIGQFKHLPPTLTLQYHFNPTGQFRPYVGAGVNYTIISDDDFGPLNRATGTVTKLDNDSWGGAFQAGFDVKVGANSYINFDIKKIYIESDVKNNVLGKVSKVKVNPVAIGIGYGFKF